MKKVKVEFEMGKELEKEISIKEMANNLSDLLDGTDSLVCATENGAWILGNGAEVLTVLTMLIRQARQNIPDEVLKYGIELAFKDEKGFLEALKEKIEKVQQKLAETDKEEN